LQEGSSLPPGAGGGIVPTNAFNWSQF